MDYTWWADVTLGYVWLCTASKCQKKKNCDCHWPLVCVSHMCVKTQSLHLYKSSQNTPMCMLQSWCIAVDGAVLLPIQQYASHTHQSYQKFVLLKIQWPPFVESPLKVFSVFVLDKFSTQNSRSEQTNEKKKTKQNATDIAFDWIQWQWKNDFIQQFLLSNIRKIWMLNEILVLAEVNIYEYRLFTHN